MNATRCLVSRAGGAIALLALTSNLAVGAGAEEVPGTATSLSRSPWMLQFRIERDFAFGGFQDAGLSVQRSLSDRSALRLGVGVAASSGTSSRLDQDFNFLQSQGVDESAHGQSYGVDLQWIRYRRAGDKTRVYWGMGPSVGYGRSRVKDTVSNDLLGPYLAASGRRSTWNVGGGAVAGAEWWPVTEFGLVFEYGMSIRYLEVEQVFWRESPPSQTTDLSRSLSKSWEAEVASVRLGVGIRM